MSLPVASRPRLSDAIRGRGLRGGAVGLAALAFLSLPGLALARQPAIRTGFTDHATYQGDRESRLAALRNTRAARSRYVRLTTSWLEIAPREPPTAAAAADPSWEGYRWERLDAAVSDVEAGGLDALVSFTSAPAWAEGPGRPPVGPAHPTGSWRPSAAAYRLFARAAARRYSGRTPDPNRLGALLPRVRFWQAWNEPNLTDFLTPQWRYVRGRPQPASPDHYRLLNNAFYDGVKSVFADNVVVTAGTAPYGEPAPGGRRMPPALFTRRFLCVVGRERPRRGDCGGERPRFDALAHHPYPITTPRRPAHNIDDVVIGDMSKIVSILRFAERARLVAPAGRKRVWATEFSWDTSPPDPDGIPVQVEARYAESALYLLWKQGVHVGIWYLLRDEAPGRGFPYTLQSGVYFRSATVAEDRPKPALTAFRFPFVIDIRRGSDAYWGIAPAPGAVRIQRRGASGWSTVKTVRAASDRLFAGRMAASAHATYRAIWGAETSLTWRGRVR
jgi:hypothetical protein